MPTEGPLGPKGAPPERRQKALVWLVGILVALAVAWALRATAFVTMPLAAAFFIAVAIWPLVDRSARHLPRGLRWLGVAAALALVVVALALFFAGIWFSASQVAASWTDYDDRFAAWWLRISELFDALPGTGEAAVEGFDVPGLLGGEGNPLSFVGDLALGILGSVWRLVAVLVVIVFFVLLMLTEAPVWRDKLADGPPGSRAAALATLVGDVASRFRRFVVVRSALGAASGLLYWAWLEAWGIDFALVWGVLAFLLNFIPSLGSLVAGLLPALFAFVQVEPGTALAVAGGLLVIEQIMGNWVDPRLQGRQLALSPLVVLVMLMVWGWIWGVAGALLAVPMTVLLAMTFARVPALAPLALALANVRSRAELRERLGDGASTSD